MKTLLLSLLILISIQTSFAQTMESAREKLGPAFSILTTWGVRPEWDETSENIYFLDKLVGDVFKINIRTREVSAVTSHFYHGGIYRAQCLPNGDLLLAMGSDTFNAKDPEHDRHRGLRLFILKKTAGSLPVPLGEVCDEGPAVSKNKMLIAWTLPGQREIVMADVVYEDGVPKLANRKTVISYKDSAQYVRLETQDFRPPLNEELIYTHYWGDARDQYHHSHVFGFNLKTGVVMRYTNLPDSYNEAEGIFPNGEYTLVESDRHQPMSMRNKYKLDIYKLKLDGSEEVERLVNFSTEYAKIRSDNPVVSRTGKLIAYQFGFMEGAGNGRGIFLLDLELFEKLKKQKDKQNNGRTRNAR